jgi:transcriptional regulator with XRE-family HTH domain
MDTSYFKKNIGKSLKKIRKKNKYTQQTIADYLKLNRSSYANIERGLHLPRIDKILDLSLLYKLPIHHFFLFHPTSMMHEEMIKSLDDENRRLRDKIAAMEKKLREEEGT